MQKIMQIKTYAIPLIGGEALNEEMNSFLRSKKILDLDKQLVVLEKTAFWSFCISYLEDAGQPYKERNKPDYRQELGEAGFQRFSRMREIRKQLAQDESLPAYAIFTDEELSSLAKIEDLNMTNMKNVKGVGEKKVEKYGQHFIKELKNEKDGKPD